MREPVHLDPDAVRHSSPSVDRHSGRFTKERITSTDWVTYPILRFADAPKVTLVNVHPCEYITVNPDFSAGGDKIDMSKGNTNAFTNGLGAFRLR